MRFLGILLIILAHVNPPGFIFQARTFDVPMMVFVSGMSYYISGKLNVKIVPYVISRFKRLVLPVWVFFTFFFLFAFLFNFAELGDKINSRLVVLTFLLSGFDYVWIIKVFLLIAILSPTLTFIANKFNGYSISIISILLLITSSVISNVDIFEFNTIIKKLLLT
ncbi:TPA: acyltransferase family protein [Pluralibacter gergoviae]